MPNIICADADFSGVAVDFYDPTLLPAALSADMYALYLFGSDMPMPQGWDYSGHARHLTRFGDTAPNALSETLSQSDYFVMPFIGDAAIAAGTAGELTMFGITKAAAGSVLASNQDLNISFDFVGLHTIDASVAVRAYMASGTNAGVATDAHRGTAPEFLAGTYTNGSLKAYRRFPSFALASGSASPAAPPSTAGRVMRIGALSGSGSSALTGTADLTCVGLATRVFDSTELESLYTSLHDWLVAKSAGFWS
jgi:hypothetical protein